MNGYRWVRVTRSETVPLREGRAVTLAGREIAIFNLGDRFLATDNQCPHQGGPLCDGIVAGDSVVCPLHAWKVRLDSGVVERPAVQERLHHHVPDAPRGRGRLDGAAARDAGLPRRPRGTPREASGARHRQSGRGQGA